MSRNPYAVSDQQFVSDVINNGGASRHLLTLSDAPANGYMVGGVPAANGRPYHASVMDIHRFNENAVLGHARELQANLNNQDVYQGGWRNDGKVHLDASSYHSDRNEALSTGRSRKQQAVYDLGEEKDVQTSPGKHKAGAHKARLFRDRVTPTKDSGGKHRYEGKHVSR